MRSQDMTRATRSIIEQEYGKAWIDACAELDGLRAAMEARYGHITPQVDDLTNLQDFTRGLRALAVGFDYANA